MRNVYKCMPIIQEGWCYGNIHLTNIFPMPAACQVPVLPLTLGKRGLGAGSALWKTLQYHKPKIKRQHLFFLFFRPLGTFSENNLAEGTGGKHKSECPPDRHLTLPQQICATAQAFTGWDSAGKGPLLGMLGRPWCDSNHSFKSLAQGFSASA